MKITGTDFELLKAWATVKDSFYPETPAAIIGKKNELSVWMRWKRLCFFLFPLDNNFRSKAKFCASMACREVAKTYKIEISEHPLSDISNEDDILCSAYEIYKANFESESYKFRVFDVDPDCDLYEGHVFKEFLLKTNKMSGKLKTKLEGVGCTMSSFVTYKTTVKPLLSLFTSEKIDEEDLKHESKYISIQWKKYEEKLKEYFDEIGVAIGLPADGKKKDPNTRYLIARFVTCYVHCEKDDYNSLKNDFLPFIRLAHEKKSADLPKELQNYCKGLTVEKVACLKIIMCEIGYMHPWVGLAFKLYTDIHQGSTVGFRSFSNTSQNKIKDMLLPVVSLVDEDSLTNRNPYQNNYLKWLLLSKRLHRQFERWRNIVQGQGVARGQGADAKPGDSNEDNEEDAESSEDSASSTGPKDEADRKLPGKQKEQAPTKTRIKKRSTVTRGACAKSKVSGSKQDDEKEAESSKGSATSKCPENETESKLHAKQKKPAANKTRKSQRLITMACTNNKDSSSKEDSEEETESSEDSASSTKSKVSGSKQDDEKEAESSKSSATSKCPENETESKLHAKQKKQAANKTRKSQRLITMACTNNKDSGSKEDSEEETESSEDSASSTKSKVSGSKQDDEKEAESSKGSNDSATSEDLEDEAQAGPHAKLKKQDANKTSNKRTSPVTIACAKRKVSSSKEDSEEEAKCSASTSKDKSVANERSDLKRKKTDDKRSEISEDLVVNKVSKGEADAKPDGMETGKDKAPRSIEDDAEKAEGCEGSLSNSGSKHKPVAKESSELKRKRTDGNPSKTGDGSDVASKTDSEKRQKRDTDGGVAQSAISKSSLQSDSVITSSEGFLNKFVSSQNRQNGFLESVLTGFNKGYHIRFKTSEVPLKLAGTGLDSGFTSALLCKNLLVKQAKNSKDPTEEKEAEKNSEEQAAVNSEDLTKEEQAEIMSKEIMKVVKDDYPKFMKNNRDEIDSHLQGDEISVSDAFTFVCCKEGLDEGKFLKKDIDEDNIFGFSFDEFPVYLEERSVVCMRFENCDDTTPKNIHHILFLTGGDVGVNHAIGTNKDFAYIAELDIRIIEKFIQWYAADKLGGHRSLKASLKMLIWGENGTNQT